MEVCFHHERILYVYLFLNSITQSLAILVKGKSFKASLDNLRTF